MRRLTGQDAGYLYGETRTQYAHTLKLIVTEPYDESSFEERKGYLEAALHVLPMLRWRVVPTPFGLHHPLAIEDPDFDLDDHVHRAALPSPGGQRELASFVSEVVGRPLDRSRPLWELWLVEGLERGQTATVLKMHHALADGATTARLLGQAATVRPGDPLPAEATPWQPERIPGWGPRVRLALADLPPHLARIWSDFLRAARATRRRLAAQDPVEQPTRLYDCPPTPFNRLISGSRRYAFTALPLEALKQVKTGAGVTFNDVFLAIVSGALRSYLGERGELPTSPLTATCPVNTRVPDAPPVLNSVSNFFVKLATDLADPLERLEAIHADAKLGKAHFEATRGAQLLDLLDLLPPPLRIFISGVPMLQKRLGRASASNVVASNVAGPREPLYAGSGEISAFFSVGPLIEGIGINFTAYSYCDRFNVSVLTDPRMVPDPWHIVELLQTSLADLQKATVDRVR